MNNYKFNKLQRAYIEWLHYATSDRLWDCLSFEARGAIKMMASKDDYKIDEAFNRLMLRLDKMELTNE
jgi:hypothetical protein